MLFNSIQYLIFLPIVVLLYYIFPKKHKSLLLLICSLFFYACWIPKYLFLILGTIIISYIFSIFIDKAKNLKLKKVCLSLSIIIILGILVIFKYYNFFINNINFLIAKLNINFQFNNAFSIILPIGISFYTFQIIGYLVDIYRKDCKCEYNFINYALFISFFPQLVAGPIERSKNLLSQLSIDHKFNYVNFEIGLRYILSGMFRKIVIADTAAIFVNAIYNNVQSYTGIVLVLAIILFSIQIYCDFSGYSLIAIGSSKLLGINLIENFKSPYFSTSIKEFWSRWHISLSTWFRDYIYFPLGGSKKGKIKKLFNLFIVFFVSGMWHGASYTFIIWGIIHGVYRIIEDVLPKFNNYIIIKRFFTYILVIIAWIFFRANSVSDAIYIFSNMFNNFNIRYLLNSVSDIIYTSMFNSYTLKIFIIITLLVSISILSMEDYIMYKYNINISDYYLRINKFRYLLYFVQVVFVIFTFLSLNATYGQTGQFIYFQF